MGLSLFKGLTVKFLFNILFLLILVCSFQQTAFAHSTAVAYCTQNGNLRIYMEHWHNNATSFTGAIVNITVTLDGVATNYPNVPVSGYINNTPIGSLPCSGTVSSAVNVSSPCGASLTYNDWAIFDFPIPGCFETLQVTINNTTGSVVLLPGCGGLYPATAPEVIIEDVDPPNPDCSILVDKLDYNCYEDFPPISDLINFNATDDCTDVDDITMTVSDIIISEASCPSGLPTIDRIYTFTDDYNHQSQCIQKLGYIDDTTPPKISCPRDVVLDCGPSLDDNVLQWIDGALTDDDCLEVPTVTTNYSSSGFPTSPPTSGSQLVTFTTTDICGNSSTCAATVTVRDRGLPEITCPSDITIECGDPNNDPLITTWLENVSATDECDDNITITNNFTALSAQECGGITTVTFIATDGSGNRGICRSTITHMDTSPPEFLMKPQDITVECINSNGAVPAINAWTAARGNAMAIDECDPTIIWSFTLDSEVPLCGYTYERTYTFTITDDCGNSSTSVATATVEDNTPPRINLVWDELIQTCSVNNETNLASYLETNRRATDVCSLAEDVEIDWVLFNDSPSCGGTIDRTYLYTATDACGNTSTAYFHYATTDVAVPTWSGLPGALDLECGEIDNNTKIQEWIDAIEDSMFDACGGELDITNDWDGSILPTCNAANRILFTLTDECGNSRTVSRRLRLLDRIAPVYLNCPGDMTVNVDVDNCGSNVIFSTPIVYDQCSSGLVPTQTVGPASGSSFPVGTTLIRYDVRDNCNRLGRCEFNITVVDSDIPSISCPSNAVEVCVDSGTCAWVGDGSLSPIAMENCATANITYTVTGATSSSGNTTAVGLTYQLGTSTVCYTVTDAASNTSSCCFDVIVSDCEDPVLSCPENNTVECDGGGNTAELTAWQALATATDNCTIVSVSNLAFNTISGCGTANTTVYQFTAVDAAGNESQCFASFIIEDTTLPLITTAASDGDSDCENANADLLDWLNNHGYAAVTDVCGDVSWSHDFDGGAMTSCSGVTSVMVTFTASDDCGNTATTQASFNVDDTEAPVISCPTSVTLECGDVLNSAVIELWLNSASATDNCTEPTIANNYPDGYAADCGDTGAYTVVFTATDDCKNTASCTATITIDDSMPPSFIMKPQDLIVECGPDAPAPGAWIKSLGGAMAEDQCDANLTWNVEGVGDDPGCGETNTFEYNFEVMDDCGNMSSATAYYIIEDTQAPTVMPPADLTVECGAIATSLKDWQATASASDECGDGFTFQAILFNTISDCGDSYTEVYQFTATDACGNQGTALASYTIKDTTVPSITCPAVLALECGSIENDQLIIDWLASATGADTCGDPVFSHDFDGSLPANCGGVVAVTFMATDACDNATSCVVNMTMDDTALPDFVNCPNDMTINVDVDVCGSNPIFSTPLALDDCGVSIVQTAGIASGNTFPLGTTAIEFTATDDCGNSRTCSYNITVVDSDIPLIICPGPMIMVCADEGICTWASEDIGPILGQENCPDYTITYTVAGMTTASGADDASGTVLNLGHNTICYTVTDDSGNSSSCCFHTHVRDCDDPVITCPSTQTFECDGAGNITDLTTWLAGVIGTDNCDVAPVLTNAVYNTISDCGGGSATTYEFAATDEAGNVSKCTADFIIKDRVAPVLDAPAEGLTVDCESGSTNAAAFIAWLNNNGGAAATDLCSELTWSHNYTEELSDLCGETGVRTVTFTATDACGNPTMTTALFEIRDITDPELTCPLPITLDCNDLVNDAVIENWLTTASATDACSDVIIDNAFPAVLVEGCGDTGTYTVTFTATDDCDNVTTCNSVITIEDNTAPVFDLDPTDLILECADADNATLITAWLAANGNGIATDVCSAVVWTYVALEAIPACGSTTSTPYIFTVTDDCDNSSTRMASVITENTTDPILFVPENEIVECDGGGNIGNLEAWLLEVSGTSECGEVSLDSELYNTISACGGGNEQVYIFTATDDCGNESTGIASFLIEDTSSPTPVCPENLVLECGEEGNDQAIAAWLLSTDITDASDCSNYTLSNNFSGDLPGLVCDGSTGIIVQFTAIDDCDNTAVCTSTITMDDTVAPYFENCPTDITVNVDVDLCTSNVVYSQPVALDVCDESADVVLTSGIASGTAFPIGTTTILFTATDECDNTSTCTFDITVEDSDIPLIDCPSNRVVVCNDEGLCTWEATGESSAIYAENCAAQGYTVTYTVTGATTASSLLTGVNDVDTDNIVFNLGTSEVCYIITDEASNSAQCCFDIIVEDCESPTITCPADLVVECDGSGNIAELGAWKSTVSGGDNCDANLSFSELVFNTISGCGDTNTEVYQFTVEDASGNRSTCLAEFKVEDTTDPVLVNDTPFATTVQCDGESNLADFLGWLQNNAGLSTVNESCGAYEWMNDYEPGSDEVEGCNGVDRFFRIDVNFWVVDECGNVSNVVEKRWRIEDTIQPELTCPNNIILECDNNLNDIVISNWLSTAMSEDLCQGVIDVTNNYGDVFVDGCGKTVVHTVTFETIDQCGNGDTCERTITIQDTTDPTIEAEAIDLILECSGEDNEALVELWVTSNGGAVASDACADEPLVWSIISQVEINECGITSSATYTFQVEDNCGNTSTTKASVILEDTTPPVLTVPVEQTEECNNIVITKAEWLEEVTATDDCGVVTITSVLWNTISGCGGTDSETYLFTATDACGNETTGFADYIIVDTSTPTVVCPANLPLICGNESNDQIILNWLSTATSTDEFSCSAQEITSDYPESLPIPPCPTGLDIIVTFTVTDACANTSSCMSTITMSDTASPYFVNCPLPMTVNVDVDLCETNVVYSQPVALDDCDENVNVVLTSGIASGAAFPIGTTTLLFTATDDCGNTETCTFDITVVDSDTPSIDCPSNDVYVCTDAGICTWEATDESSAIFAENCAEQGYTVTYIITGATTASSPVTGVNDVDTDNVVFNLGVSEVCYTITDEAGNSAQCCFDIIVEDCEDPTITCPADLVVECDGTENTTDLAAWLGSIAGDDNCDVEVALTNKIFNTISACGDASETVYEFTSEDNFGNRTICQATFTIEDTTVPVIETEATDLTVECSDTGNSTALLAWLQNVAGALATDICNEVTWTNNYTGDLSDDCGGTGEITVIFTATDACGNMSTTDAIFTIEDTTAPVLACPQNITLECSADINDAVIANWLQIAESYDACSEVMITNTYPAVLVDGCGETGITTVTFTATDDCGITTTCDRTITLEDTTAPTIEAEAIDLVLECADANNATLIANWEAAFGTAVASDACSDEALVWVILSQVALSDCGDTGSTLYTFQVTDNCANTSTTTASVIIEDTTAPELIVPEDQVEECNKIIVSVDEWVSEATATDACGNVTITSVIWNTISGCGGTDTELYLFTATDACGNQTTGFAEYDLDDDADPIIVCPDNLSLVCGNENNDQIIQSWLNSVTASDAFGCSEIEISSDFPGRLPILDCNGSVGIDIMFVARDACGNSRSCISVITMDDTTAPYFSNCPLDMTVNVDVDLCETNVVYSQPVALDDCDENVSVVLTSGIASGAAFPIGTTTLLFTATDDCGNTETCTFDITVVDSDTPSIDCPSNDVYVCTDAEICTWEATDQSSAIFAENCAEQGYTVTYIVTGATTASSALVGVNDVDTDNVVFNLGVSEVCYTISDAAGNSAQCCFDIIVEDCEDPTITCPADLVVECDGTDNTTDLAAWLGSIAGDDNCDVEVALTNKIFNTISACGDASETVYEFTSEDNFGNRTICQATFTIEDTTVPVIETEATDLTVECSDTGNSTALLAWLQNVAGALATDICNEVTWTNNYTGDLSDDCGGTGEITVIFTATDACGNMSTTDAIFTIEDTTAPVLACPQNITLECSADINDAVIANWLQIAESYDACSEVMITNTYPAVLVDGCGETGITTVTFTATDDCGITTTCDRTITLEDTTAPTIEAEAIDLVLECADANNATLIANWEAAFGTAVASDACSDEALVWVILSQVALSDCGDTGSTLYTFQVTDNCANTSTTTASVIIEDTTAPELTVPEDQTEECNNIVVTQADWFAEATSTDDCGSVTITSVLWNTISGCGGTDSETYLFTATDACGNETTGFADYIIVDTSTPTVVCPANLPLICGNESNDQIILNWINSATSTDEYSCSAQEITSDYPESLPIPPCPTGLDIIVTFTVTDACANTSSCMSTITMSDTASPYFVNCPLPMTVNVDVDLCETNVVYSQPVALDDCDENVGVVLTSGIASGAAFPIGATTLLFTATDDCGNTETCEFDITVVDSDTPSIDCPSNDVYVCTDDATCTWIATEQSSAIFAENCAEQGYTVTYAVTGATTASSALVGVNDVDTDNVVFNLGVSEVCYTITDEAGNSAQCCFDIIVEDCEEPTITCPADLVVECDGAENTTDLAAWLGSIAGDDNCDAEVTLTNKIFNTISACGNSEENVYEFSSEDNFGNTTICQATFTIEDTTVPVIETEATDLTVECSDTGNSTALLAWLQNVAGALATDICNEVTWTNNYTGDLSDDCGGTGEITVIFTATDACGNVSTTDAVFTIEDTTAPDLTCPENITLECSADINAAVVANWLSTATATDQCSDVMVVNNYEEVFAGACGMTGVHTVTFTVVDDCDNSTTCDRTITLVDTVDPVIEVQPQDLILECSGIDNATLIAEWEAGFGGAFATDGCSDEALTWSIIAEVQFGSCGVTGTTLYTFQVTDNCLNTATAQASVVIEDTTPPVLIVPEDQTEECSNILVTVEAWQATVTGSDTCGEVTFSSTLWNTVSGCGDTNSETYIFVAIDACGNQTTGFADYIIEDTSDPTITCPDNLALTCGNEANDQIISNWLASATATDEFGCSSLVLTHDYPADFPVLDCNSGLGINITFTAEDDCSNSDNCVSTITMDDTEAPYYSNCPIDMTVNVDVGRCGSNVVYSQPIALDNCDENVDVALIAGMPSGNPFPLGTTTLSFEAVDGCGNSSICSFDITVVDTDTPSISCPSNDVVVCTDLATCAWLSTDQTDPTYNDNCPGQVLTYTISGATTATSALTGENTVEGDVLVFGLGESEIVYTISDPSGNVATCSFDVIVKDCEDPTITCNDQMDIACGDEDLASWFAAIAATVLDNCDAIPVLSVDTLLLTDFSSCGSTFNRVYRYTVTDLEGNTSSCLATYETDDTVVPTIVAPAEDLILECRDASQSTALLAWLNDVGGAAATDVCSGLVSWTNDFVGDLTSSCGGNGEVLVTFTAADECGNTSTTAATFRIEDNTAPVLSCPENLILECADRINDAVIANWLRTATALDECEGKTFVTQNYPEVFVDACGNTGEHTVTFTTIDNCNNETSCDRIITIIDTTVPDIQTPAEDLVLSCGSPTNASDIIDWLADNGGAAATDACSDEPLVWTNEILETSEGCGGFSTITYVFIVTDNCGNRSTTTATVEVTDDTVPEFDAGPFDQVIECYPTGNEVALMNWLNSNGGAVVSDDCATAFEWEYDLINVIDNCGNTLIRTYRFTVADDCGNSSTSEANFEIHDTTEPDITKDAEEFTTLCNGSSNSAEILNWLNNNGYAEANDRCGNITWSNNYGTIVADCGATGGVEVTFTATDECGNFSTTTADFIINDDMDPYWILAPQNLEVECDGSNDPMGQIESWLNLAGGGEAADDCSAISYSNDFSIINLECDMQGGVEVVFTVTDACGNFASSTAMIIITDDVPPVITLEAANQTVECDGAGNTTELQTWLNAHAYAEAADACSSALVWNYELRSSFINCGQTSTSFYDFTATDACGNVSVVTMAAFLVEDQTAPYFDVLPMDETVECDGAGNDAELQRWLTNHAGAIAADICSEPIVWAYDLVMDEDSCGITGIQVFRFTITDDCGNSYSEEATFIIEDTTSPALIAGADMNMEECDDNITGNILDFDFWLESNAGATATDACGDMIWTNNYHPDNWTTTCGNTRYVDVVFTVTDACGNTSETKHRFGVGDITPPEFINCPRPPVITDAPDGWCSAYANYATPIAEDNCSALTVTQVDETGLQSGDLFPVGLTIITFVAEDECGNSSTCELKIIVNDFHTPPSIVCPDNVEVDNDPSMCGAIVDNIAPVNVEDNCPDNLTVIYEIQDQEGGTIACGYEDASGVKFPVGQSTVVYTVIDQPLLLITEIIQDGVTTGVELTNFGPGSLDITCLDIVREGPDNETHNVPNGTVLPVGGIYTQLFSNINAASAAGYYLSFVGTVIDGVSINGHSGVSYPFTGAVFGENIYRASICDHHTSDDFTLASSCFAGSFGSLNPGLPVMTDNGSMLALQEAVPSSASCSFEINVTDTEPAFCAEFDTLRVCLSIAEVLAAGSCTNIPFTIPAGVTVGDVSLLDLLLTHPDAGALSFHLTSPSGTSIYLFGGLCSGSGDVDISLDDTADNSLSAITCGALGQGASYQPIGDFSDFFDESAGGVWSLNVANHGVDAGTIEGVCLEILELVPYSQADVFLENDLGQCGAEYTWQHPQISDNCGLAIMTITYESDNQIAIPANGDIATGTIATEFFGVGTTRIIYTIIDQYGNKSICGFEVVVEDNENPALDASLCVDQTIQLAANQCFVPASALGLPPLIDNCGSSNISFTPTVSQGLPSGDHPLILGFTDAFGNNTSCNFMVTVLPFVPSTDQMICVGQINLSLDADCEEEITADMMLAPGGSHGCTDDYCVLVTDEQGNEVVGALATEEHIGQLLTVKVCTDCNGGNCCWGNILIENKLIPSINCPDAKVTIVCNEIFEPSVVGLPILETCEQEVYFSYEDNITFGDMCDDFPGFIERIWTVTDESNNTIECVQEITIERFDVTAVNFPDDTIITTADINCVDVADDPTLIHPDHTGYPDLNGVPISETGDGLCSHFWNWDDQILFNCEGSYEILRKWLVRDMCEDIVWGTNPIEYYQSIKVIDNMPPQFVGCQDGLVFASADFDCSTDVYLNDYMPEIIEVCGSIKDTVFSVSPGTVMERPAGSGEYYLTNMAPGIHTVKITVRDQCSNYNRCTFEVEVEDKNGPNVLCEQDINISLNNIGVAEIPAEVLDDGSFDNCTSVMYQIYRMDDGCANPSDLEPGDYVTFCCNDVGTGPHQTVLRVWDDADGDGMHGTVGDYYNECMVRLRVTDATIPDISCPDNLVIQCDQDYTNLQLTGQPSIGSACSFVAATHVDDVEALTDCSTGTVIRTWNIPGYNIDCKQTISIQAAMPFTENDIVWPQDFEGDCSDVNVASQPIVNSPACSQIGIDLKADTFFFNQEACYKVINNWEVVDWCQYDSTVDPAVGSWTHQQVIKITSSELPSITGCGDKFVAVESADCSISEITVTNSAVDNSCGAAAILSWNYQIDSDNDGEIDIDGSASGNNPEVTVENVQGGMMTIIWQVVDGCGNAAACTQQVFPEDGKSPTAYCNSISTVVMEDVGEVVLWASDIDAGSTDNCTAQEDLVLSFDAQGTQSSMTYDCDDIPNGVEATLNISIYVTDEAGNQSNCISQLTLQDPNDACPDTPNVMGRIGGLVATELEEPVMDVQTYLNASNSVMDDMDMTNELGEYVFDQLPMTMDYQLRPFKNDDHLNGISTLDIVYIQRHILGLDYLDSPYKIIASDVTHDERINGQDLVQLRKLLLGQIDTFYNNTSWRFVDKSFVFADTLRPFPFDEDIILRDSVEMGMHLDFVAVKIGDVDNSIILSLDEEFLDFRSDFGIYYSLESYSKEHEHLIPVFSNEEGLIYGFQFALELEEGEILDVLPGSVDLSADNFVIRSKDEVAFSWNSELGAVSNVTIPLFYLSVKDMGSVSRVLSLKKENPKAEIYLGESLRVKVPSLSLYDDTGNSQFVLYQNEPNPFKEWTDIKFFLPSQQEVNLSFYSADGQKLHSVINIFEAGEHNYRLSSEQFLGNSVIYYNLSSELYNDSKKMIIVR